MDPLTSWLVQNMGRKGGMLFVGVPFNSPDGFVVELLMLNLPSECESSRAGSVMALSSACDNPTDRASAWHKEYTP